MKRFSIHLEIESVDGFTEDVIAAAVAKSIAAKSLGTVVGEVTVTELQKDAPEST